MPVRPLCPELAEKARVELNEDPKKLEDGIQHLKDWIAKQPHLRARTDDQWLATFLRGCKFSLERAKEKIDLYYSIRNFAPELQSVKPTDPKFMEILKLGVLLVLPKTEKPDDPRVLMMRMGQFDPSQYPPTEIYSVANTVQKILYMEDDTYVVAGGKNIMDFSGATIAHLSHMNPVMMKKMVVAGQDAAPIRLKGAHVLHPPAGFETVYNILKGFMNEKMRKRFNVYGKDIEALYQNFSKEILPAEYGGNGGTVQEIVDSLVKKVEEYRTWLAEEENFGTDETKRPGKPKTAEDMFGVEGSFRQLQVD